MEHASESHPKIAFPSEDGEDKEPDSPSLSNNHLDDKGLTFRRRRLSLTNLREAGEAADAQNGGGSAAATTGDGVGGKHPGQTEEHPEDEDDDPFEFFTEEPPPPFMPDNGETDDSQDAFKLSPAADEIAIEDEKAQSFRKRRLSLTSHSFEDAGSTSLEPNSQRRRRDSEISQESIRSGEQERLKSRTVHASELLAHPPPSPSIHQLYRQRSAPPQRPSLDAMIPQNQQPKWKVRYTRHLHDDERTLPFPRDVVGTFSCHGVEPIYDDEYLDDDDSHGWNHDTEKPTTAAKINQDRGGVSFPYGNSNRTALFAVYDGHGQGGELVAQFALHEVQRRLEKHADFQKDIEKAFKDTFLGVDNSLIDEEIIEPHYAGTTACVALLRDQKLVLANLGDSRAVCARRNADGTYKVIDLTIDQNPDLPEEQARIEKMGGFVSPPPEPGLSARVWLDPDCTQIGLAMARSIGDHAVKEIGVIADPVVSFHDVSPEDEFVIFATDGVWEFVSSQEAVDVVAGMLDRGATRACQALIETAAAKWHDEEGDYRDDITALVVRLNHLWKSGSAKKSK